MKSNIISAIIIYGDLTKYRLSLAITISAVTGYFLFSADPGPDFILMIMGIYFLTSGASVLNQLIEREQDLLMERTRDRPIPSGKISLKAAVILIALLLCSGSLFLMATGLVPVLLGALGVIIYNLGYTSLKRVTVLSILPGALVGSIPPLIGFSVAGGQILSRGIMWFAGYMFMWQLPHFWLLALRYGQEYNSAGFKTFVNYFSENQIRWLVFIWVLFSCILPVWFFINETGSSGISSIMIILTLIFMAGFFRSLFIRMGSRDLLRAFIMLNSYTLFVMLALIILSFSTGGVGEFLIDAETATVYMIP